ncbi:MAG: hypothetical protein QW587_09640 [Candidatus Bathyarchaeia archaeon]
MGLLAVRASWQRSALDTDLFLKIALKACLNKPLLMDPGPLLP